MDDKKIINNFIKEASEWLESYAQFSLNSVSCTYNSSDLAMRFINAMRQKLL